MDRKIHEDGKGDKDYKDSVHDMTQEAHRGGIHREHSNGDRSNESHETHIWGNRSASAPGILEKVKGYLLDYPVSFGMDADSFLGLLYYAFAEYNTVETPEFKEEIDPLKEKLRGLADTDEESDEYMDIVFSLCAAYERQGYMEGIKVGARLVMELMED